MKMKKEIWIIAIIVIVIVGIITRIAINNMQKNSNINTNANEEKQNKIVNEIDLETNTIEENIIENVQEVQNVEQNTSITSTEIFTEEPKTEEEKAISIVTKDYGSSQNVKIGIEGMDETGRQIVVVRNAQTTQAIAFYFVNVSDGTFTKKEMN